MRTQVLRAFIQGGAGKCGPGWLGAGLQEVSRKLAGRICGKEQRP